MPDEPATETGTEPKPGDLVAVFDYIKSNYFRVIYVTGVHGNVSPALPEVYMGLFNERGPLSRKEVYGVGGDGTLSREPIGVEKRNATMVREVEACLVLRKEAALAMRKWLDEALKVLQQLEDQRSGKQERAQ